MITSQIFCFPFWQSGRRLDEALPEGMDLGGCTVWKAALPGPGGNSMFRDVGGTPTTGTPLSPADIHQQNAPTMLSYFTGRLCECCKEACLQQCWAQSLASVDEGMYRIFTNVNKIVRCNKPCSTALRRDSLTDLCNTAARQPS